MLFLLAWAYPTTEQQELFNTLIFGALVALFAWIRSELRYRTALRDAQTAEQEARIARLEETVPSALQEGATRQEQERVSDSEKVSDVRTDSTSESGV